MNSFNHRTFSFSDIIVKFFYLLAEAQEYNNKPDDNEHNDSGAYQYPEVIFLVHD